MQSSTKVLQELLNKQSATVVEISSKVIPKNLLDGSGKGEGKGRNQNTLPCPLGGPGEGKGEGQGAGQGRNINKKRLKALREKLNKLDL